MGIDLVSFKKITMEKSLRLGFPATNNEAEYEVLLDIMMMVSKLGGKAIQVGPSWMYPLVSFLRNGTLPKE